MVLQPSGLFEPLTLSFGGSSTFQSTNNLVAAETTVVITYDILMTNDLIIHPVFQWIQHPSGKSQ